MTGIRPTAVGYASGPKNKAFNDQSRAVCDHAAAKGFALEHIIFCRLETVAISQLVADARAHGARVVLVPAGVRMAEVQACVTHDLGPHGAVCVVICQTHPVAPQRAGRLVTDLSHRRPMEPV